MSELQAALASQLAAIKVIDGFVSLQRVVCGDCNDFKVVIKMEFGPKFEAAIAGPLKAEQETFVTAIGAIAGVSKVETQIYTLETL